MPFIKQVGTCKPINPISIKNTFWKAFSMLREKYYGLRKPHDCEPTYFKLIWKTQVVKVYSSINDNSLECIGKGGSYWNEAWGLLGEKVMSRVKTRHLSDHGTCVEWNWCVELMWGCVGLVWGWGGWENFHHIRKLLKQRISSSWRRTRHDPVGVTHDPSMWEPEAGSSRLPEATEQIQGNPGLWHLVSKKKMEEICCLLRYRDTFLKEWVLG